MEIFKAASKQMDNSATLNLKHQHTIDIKNTNEIKSNEVIASEHIGANKKDISEDLKKITDKLNMNIKDLNTNIRFSYNDKIDSLYINVEDKANGNVIRKIPSEEAMRLTAYFKEIVGMLFDKKE